MAGYSLEARGWGYPEKDAWWEWCRDRIGTKGGDALISAIERIVAHLPNDPSECSDPGLRLPIHYEAKCLRVACLLGFVSYDWAAAGYDFEKGPS